MSTYPQIQLIPAQEILRNADKLAASEKFDTYEENAQGKARLANHGSHYPALADDSGLEVLALGGRPGVRSARFALASAGKTQDGANTDKLLSEMKGKTGQERSAKFICVVSLVMEGIELSGRGELEGTILESPRGTEGFGYDPVFLPNGATKTLAEMSSEEKNQLSHRARALQDLFQKIQLRGVVFTKP